MILHIFQSHGKRWPLLLWYLLQSWQRDYHRHPSDQRPSRHQSQPQPGVSRAAWPHSAVPIGSWQTRVDGRSNCDYSSHCSCEDKGTWTRVISFLPELVPFWYTITFLSPFLSLSTEARLVPTVYAASFLSTYSSHLSTAWVASFVLWVANHSSSRLMQGLPWVAQFLMSSAL